MSELRDTGARYELDEQGETSWADYRKSGDRIFIDHVEAPEALRGTGAAGRLCRAQRRHPRQGPEGHPDLRVCRRLAAAQQSVWGSDAII